MTTPQKEKKVVITQSNYIPWRGYFDLISKADELVLYDSVQYTRRDWRNRNQIKTNKGLYWLTVPVKTKGNYHTPIKDITIVDYYWAEKHWNTIEQNYKKSEKFDTYSNHIQKTYESLFKIETISEINLTLIKKINEILGINVNIRWSWSYDLDPNEHDKTNKIISICNQANSKTYISAPSAKNYLREDLFLKNNINLVWMDYSNYQKYPQLHGEYIEKISILDLILNVGKESSTIFKEIGNE